MEYVAEPLQRLQLRELSSAVRKTLGLESVLYFPVLPFLERVMPILFPEFHVEIVPEEDFPPNKHADTDVANHVISIREDIYEGAVAGVGRDRMTIVHEISHYLLMVVCGVKFSRAFGDAPVKTYCDPEWQAKALAGEIMCPNNLIGTMSVDEIAEQCGVSESAARYNLKIAKGGGAYCL